MPTNCFKRKVQLTKRLQQDVNVLRLTSARGEPIRLRQLGWVEGQLLLPMSQYSEPLINGVVGRPIGSAMIDIDFHQILSDRLERIQDHLQGDPDIIADQMMQGRFERIKCSFGTAASSAIPTIPLRVPGLAPGFCYSAAGIEDSTLVLTRCANP